MPKEVKNGMKKRLHNEKASAILWLIEMEEKRRTRKSTIKHLSWNQVRECCDSTTLTPACAEKIQEGNECRRQ